MNKEQAKTAMQEFIESLRAIGVTVHNTDIFLEKEKEQIMDAFVAGSERGIKEIPFNCEQYYNQAYNQTP